MNIDKKSWYDQKIEQGLHLSLWRKFALLSLFSTISLSIACIFLTYKILSNVNNQRLLLVAPTLGVGPVDVPMEAEMTESVIGAIAKRIVELNEQWSYESVEGNYDELFKFYYDHKLKELTKANLSSTKRIQFIKENSVVSTFKIEKSEHKWCSKLQSSCSIISGKRVLYINNNEPYQEKKVAFLIFAKPIYPDKENPHAIRIQRLVIDDSSSDPYENLYHQFELALKGEEHE